MIDSCACCLVIAGLFKLLFSFGFAVYCYYGFDFVLFEFGFWVLVGDLCVVVSVSLIGVVAFCLIAA